jgi:hypothetical protein
MNSIISFGDRRQQNKGFGKIALVKTIRYELYNHHPYWY